MLRNDWVCNRPDSEATAAKVVAGMTLPEKIAQLYMIRPDEGKPETVRKLAARGLLGSLLIGDPDWYENVDALRLAMGELKAISKYPLLLSSYHSNGLAQWCSIQDGLYEKPLVEFRDDPQAADDRAYRVGMEAKAAGLNFNGWLACDNIWDNRGYFLVERQAYRAMTIDQLRKLCLAEVHGFKRANQGLCACHWIGRGTGRLRLKFKEVAQESTVFRDMVGVGVDALMPCDVILEDIDATLPITMSPACLKHLREFLGFKGMLVADDVSTSALAAKWARPKTDVQMVRAGIDLLCSATVGEYEEYRIAMEKAVYADELPETRVTDAATQVVAYKIRNRIFGA